MSRKRLSKKQLKSDRFVERTFDWAHWAETHRSQVIAGVVGFVVLVGAFFVYRGMARANEERAAQEYLEARQAYFAQNYPLAAADLRAFIDQFGDTSYADDARFFLADALYEAEDAAGAVTALTEFFDHHGSSPFAASGRRLMGAAYLRLGRYGEAIEAYEEALDQAEYDGERIQIHAELAEVYEAQDQIEPAAAQYQAILELEPDGESAREARRELAELTVEPIGGTGAAGAADSARAPVSSE